MIMPFTPQKASDQNGTGFLNTSRTVCGSITSILSISVYEPIVRAAVFGSRTNSQLNTTSAAVNGLPSCQVTPFLSFQVTERPSFATPPFCTDGTSAARTGNRLPSG